LKLFALCLLAAPFIAFAAQAQLPTDSTTYANRCAQFAGNSGQIEAGNIAPKFISVTRGVPSHSFFVLAVDRAQHGQHDVACVMYYMAAIADSRGNGASSNALQSREEAIIGRSESKLAHHHHLDALEHEKRVKYKVEEMTGSKALSLPPDQTQAAIDAASTMPLSM
jgi:hypothetical protein